MGVGPVKPNNTTTPAKFEPFKKQRAKVLLGQMISKMPRWKVYLSLKEIKFVGSILADQGRLDAPYTLDTSIKIKGIYNRVVGRKIGLFTENFPSAMIRGLLLRKVCAILLGINASLTVVDLGNAAEKIGVDGIGTGTEKQVDQNNERALAYIYKNHFEQVKEQLSRRPRPLPKVKIDSAVKDISDFRPEHVTLENYDPHPTIKGELTIAGGYYEGPISKKK